MNFVKTLLFLFICVSLILSVIFSIRSFTGYLVSDIHDGLGNMKSFVLLLLGLAGTFAYIKVYQRKL
ncbi:hypothetical protein FJZ21_02690 [Candidatus Pacearchaeota archaeon]|nr:hypothetical protein [Candidatus Pacearchaeota archaeon]